MKPSRRRFLKSTLATPLAGVLQELGGRSLAAAPAAQEQELFENPLVIRYDSSCFTLNGRDTFLFSAAFHYPRCPQALWRDRLAKLKRAGFNTIETYVFWNYHEREEGQSDLSEFEAFIRLVKEMGFWMIARPGPYVCAEWERGGFPHWVAARRFPLRSNHPESLKTSQHWFSQVLPVIQRNQITTGGPIIMVQVENEYDYWKLAESEKLEYIRALARMTWNAGINVPIITCWTKEARANADPDMARVLDTCNFYPRWEVEKVPPALTKLRQEEPKAPLGVAELQGGWFSEFGGKLSLEQEGVNGAQLSLLSKTVIEQGVTCFNYYMGFGGTNFDWAAKGLTTTYDYAAPLREPGGLWEKYYAARGLGASLELLGWVLARSERQAGVVQSSNSSVSVTERVRGKSGAVFVHENSNAEQHFKMFFPDPNSPTHRIISAPREGELVLGPREMKMLPVQVPIPGGRLCYSTAEVLATGLMLDRHFLLVYDEPGRTVEISLATEDEPKIEGDFLYSYWDSEYESVVIGVRVEKTEKILIFNNHLHLVIAPRERALRSWSAEFPSKVVPGAEEPKPMRVPFITDSYLLAESGSEGRRLWADLEFLPGEHAMTALLPPLPTKCRVDGVLKEFQYDRHWRMARLSVAIPPIPYQRVELGEVETWVERFDTASGQWLTSPPRPLEEIGLVPYGYVKYRAQFPYTDEPKMFIATFADDAKQVFLNGKWVAEASSSKKQAEFALAKYAQPGTNTLEIVCEVFGSPNFGENLGELKGIESVHIGADPATGKAIDSWRIQRFPAPLRGRELDLNFGLGSWAPASLGANAPVKDPDPAFTWCRAEFTLEKPAAGWSVPWKLTFEALRDALIYLNGKFVGRYVTIGPQKDFYLPEPFVIFGGKKNVLTFALAYADHPSYVRTLRVVPYEEFSTRRIRVEFEW